MTLGIGKSLDSDLKIRVGEEVVANAKKLMIQIKDGGKVEKGLKINMNAAGYPESLRRAFDGVTYFGNNEINTLNVILNISIA